MEAFEKIAASLDATKKKVDTREQLAPLLDSLYKKSGDLVIKKSVKSKDIEAVGPLIEYHSSTSGSIELQPVFIILFSDFIVCCIVKNETKISKIKWTVDLNTSQLATSTRAISTDLEKKHGITKNCIIITELRTSDKPPFTEEFTFCLFPCERAPYDMGFWFNSIESAITSLWFDNKGLLRSSNRFRRFLFPLFILFSFRY